MVGVDEPRLRALLWQIWGLVLLALCVPVGAETATSTLGSSLPVRETANLTSLLSEPPFDANGTVLVVMTASFQKISAIDVVSQSFYTDYYLYTTWRDDRLKAGVTPPPETWIIDPERINSPDTSIVFNSLLSTYDGPPAWAASAAGVTPDGVWVVAWTRLVGPTYGKFNLQEFPFDMQSVSVIIESSNYDETQMQFSFPADITTTAILPKMPIDGWNLQSVVGTITTEEYSAFEQTFARYIVSVNIVRVPTYFVSKYIVNVTLIMIIALSMGAISSRAPDRIIVVFAAFLGIVSWTFVLVNQVPILGYNTRLDNFMMVAFFCTFLLVLYNGLLLTSTTNRPQMSKDARRAQYLTSGPQLADTAPAPQSRRTAKVASATAVATATIIPPESTQSALLAPPEDVGSVSSLPVPIAPRVPVVKKPTGCWAKVGAAHLRVVDFCIAHDVEAHIVIGIAYAAGCCYVLLAPQRPLA